MVMSVERNAPSFRLSILITTLYYNCIDARATNPSVHMHLSSTRVRVCCKRRISGYKPSPWGLETEVYGSLNTGRLSDEAS